MTLSNGWQIFAALVGVIVLWSGVLFWSVKWLLDRYQRHTDNKFREMVEENRKLERDFNQMRSDLPRHYVMREDWIRFAAVIDAKQDTLNEKVERLLERTAYLKAKESEA